MSITKWPLFSYKEKLSIYFSEMQKAAHVEMALGHKSNNPSKHSNDLAIQILNGQSQTMVEK